MASDLIAYHYLHSKPRNTLHGPLKTFPKTSITLGSATFFTVFESEDTNAGHNWLFIDSRDSLPRCAEQMSEVLDTIGSGELTVNSYDRNIISWATELLRSNPKRIITLNTLYEMRLETPPKNLDLSLPKFHSPALAALQDNGFDIEEDPEWFCNFMPENRSIITLGGERVFTVVEKATREKAACVSLLVDQEGDRMYVSSLETFPQWRRRGLAKALMEHVSALHANGCLNKEKGNLKSGEGNGMREIWLTVFCENFEAVGMYHRLGYRVNRCLWVVNCSASL